MKDVTLHKVLSARWGIKESAIKKWLEANRIETVKDLMKFGESHREAMDNALNDLWLTS